MNTLNTFQKVSVAWLTSLLSEYAGSDSKDVDAFVKDKVVEMFGVANAKGKKGKDTKAKKPADSDEDGGNDATEVDPDEKRVYILLDVQAKAHAIFYHPDSKEEVLELLASGKEAIDYKDTKVKHKFQSFVFSKELLKDVKAKLGKSFTVEVVKDCNAFEMPDGWVVKTPAVPKGKKAAAKTQKVAPKKKGKAKVEADDDAEDAEDKPKKGKKAPPKKPAAKKGKAKKEETEDSEPEDDSDVDDDDSDNSAEAAEAHPDIAALALKENKWGNLASAPQTAEKVVLVFAELNVSGEPALVCIGTQKTDEDPEVKGYESLCSLEEDEIKEAAKKAILALGKAKQTKIATVQKVKDALEKDQKKELVEAGLVDE
jgi:hypothetical protein